MDSVLGHSFSFKGVDFAQYGALVEEFQFPEAPPPNVTVIQTAQGDAYFDPINDAPRALDLNLGVWADTPEEFRNRLRAIKRLTDATLTGPGILRIDAYPGIDLYAVRTGGIQPASPTLRDAKFPLSWTVLQRDYGRDLVTGTASFTTMATEQSIGTPQGDHFARVLWYIRNTQGTDFDGVIKLQNQTVPTEVIEWQGLLQDGRWLKFGLFNADKQYSYFIGRSTAAGSDPRALSYSDVKVSLRKGIHPQIQGMVENTLLLTGPTALALAYEYYPRY